MGFHRAIKFLIIAVFVLEVVNPTTTFVREQIGSAAPHQNIVKTQNIDLQGGLQQTQTDDDKQQDEEDYLSCSATVPQLFLSPKPIEIEQTFIFFSENIALRIEKSIHRPPART